MTEDEYDEMQLLADAGMSYQEIGDKFLMPAWLVKMRVEDDEVWLRRHWQQDRKYRAMEEEIKCQLKKTPKTIA